ncbi:hypothetical protein KIPB_005290, partial [Kipferlia bialata]
ELQHNLDLLTQMGIAGIIDVMETTEEFDM